MSPIDPDPDDEYQPSEIAFVYPPNYDKIKTWAMGEQAVSHTMMQLKFNFQYYESKRALHALRRDRLISQVSDAQGMYTVMK